MRGVRIVTKILKSLFGKTVLIVCNNAETREMIAGAFQNFNCKVLLAGKEYEAVTLIHTNPTIEVVIVEVDTPISQGFEFLEKIRSLDVERPPVFFVSNQRDSHFDEAFFLGVEAIFLKPIHFDELVKGVAFSHELLMEQHSGRVHRRRRIRRAKAVFTNESTGMASHGYVTNISIGGMFICSMYSLPAANQVIDFKLQYDGEQMVELSGRAAVRWLRPIAHYGRPPGFGVEFKDLDETAKKIVSDLIDAKLA